MSRFAFTTSGHTLPARLYQAWLCTRPFWVFPPVVIGLVVWAVPKMGPTAALRLFPAGLLAWTLLEWGLHRLMHVRTGWEWFSRLQDTAHLRHHREPDDLARSLVLLRASVPLAVFFYAAALAIFRDPAAAAVFHAGLLAGYVWYEAVHLASHAGWRIPALRHLERYHQLHHDDDWTRSFGVTSPLWDWVFGTLPRR